MKKVIMPLLSLCFIIQSEYCICQSNKKSSLLVGIFDGRTPCQELAKQLEEITTPECTKIKWRVILYKDSLHQNSGTYELEGFVFRGDNILKGKWQTIKGTKTDPEATVYQLDHNVRGSLFLQKVDDNVLFFLDKEKNLMVGNIKFSYALYRATEN